MFKYLFLKLTVRLTSTTIHEHCREALLSCVDCQYLLMNANKLK